MELWNAVSGSQDGDPFAIADAVEQLEAEGWDGVTMPDTQCVTLEPYVTLSLCAQRTRTIKLGTGVSNPLTRHPSVTAAAMATLQLVSQGRALLGIGRGDSSLAYLGCAPQPIDRFEHSLQMIQAYLRGEKVPLEDAAAAVAGTRTGFDQVELGLQPPGSWLKWLPPSYVKVPMEVMVTGPKAIGIAVRAAEQVMFVMGADVGRLRWAVQTAREAAEQAGRDPASLKLGAWLIVRPHTDLEVARRIAKAGVSSSTRFLFINKKIVAPTTDQQQETIKRVARAYDMKAHGLTGAQTDELDPEFVDQFAVVGSPARCIERIEEIAELGLSKLMLSNAPSTEGPAAESHALLASEVLPAIRRRFAS
jgi:5,10-methylenetetrahydromethanopterin reductase